MSAQRTRLGLAAALLAAALPPLLARAAPPLDYEFFKARVQPIFLQKRDGHTRCYVCHAESNNAFHLQRLSPGASTWNEEQSRKNFEMRSILVSPAAPATRRPSPHPLAPRSGDTCLHAGGHRTGRRA